MEIPGAVHLRRHHALEPVLIHLKQDPVVQDCREVNDTPQRRHRPVDVVDPATVRFVDLHNWIVELDGFDDDHKRGGERVLEAVQMAWIDEAR